MGFMQLLLVIKMLGEIESYKVSYNKPKDKRYDV